MAKRSEKEEKFAVARDEQSDDSSGNDIPLNDESSSSDKKGKETPSAQSSLGNAEPTSQTSKRKNKKIYKLSLSATEDFNAKLEKRGVMYIARIPPRMNPSKIKTLLSGFGVVTRVYLVEEDAARRKRRQKMSKGGGSKRYVEGWVEWEDKRVAKHVARSLNSTPISLHKGSVHYGDLWNVKYLHKFKWSHLTEKVAYERRVREQKLRVEMMQAKRENASYTKLVETGKKLDKIEERQKKRMRKGGKTETEAEPNKKRRAPRQTKPLQEGADKAAKSAILSSLV